MKKLGCLLFSAVFAISVHAQTINMPSGTSSAEYTTCNAVFYDAGGLTGNHGANQASTITFHPGTPGMAVRIIFTIFNVGSGATLIAYDGPDDTAPVIATYDEFISPIGLEIVATADNPTGDVTVTFTSGSNVDDGWSAQVDCRAPCQAYTITIDETHTTKPMVDSLYFNVCLDEEVTFCATGNYPQSGILYNQADSNVTFTWTFGTDGEPVEGPCFTKVFDYFQGWDFILTAQDEQHCFPSAIFKGRVRVSDNPLRNIAELPDVCSGTVIPITIDTTDNATIGVTSINNSVSGTLNVADTTFLPDGSNISYTSELVYSIFEPGQTLNDINDLLGICLDLEHSYLGDLDIRITCPSGQSCQLKAYSSSTTVPGGVATAGSSGGSNIHLGFAPDPSSNSPCYLTPGVPLTYCFTPQSTTPMGGTGSPVTNITYTDPCGNTETWNQLNAGDYGSYENMNVLVGCQLNGAWTITVTDHLASDNGYIFSWGLSLSDDIIPGGWGYDVDIDHVDWLGDNIIPNTQTSALYEATITTDDPGDFTYTVNLWDEYGCNYDTTFTIHVVQTPEPELPELLNICVGERTTLDPQFDYVGPAGLIDYAWSTSETTPTITTDESGQFQVCITTYNADHSLSCSKCDTAEVVFNPQPVANFSADILENCSPLNVRLTPDITFTDGQPHTNDVTLSYRWSVTDESNIEVASSTQSSPSFSLNNAGLYSVHLFVETQFGCADSVTQTNYLTVYAQPIADFLSNPERTSLSENGDIYFINITDTTVFSENDVIHWTWNYGDGSDDTYDKNGFHTYSEWGEFMVTLSVITDRECQSTISHVVYIEADLLFPNIITPNGDGKNDVFAIKNMNPLLPNILTIYDRWGKKVYEQKNYQTFMREGSDVIENAGEGFGAEKLSDGVYYYTFHYEGYTKAVDYHGTLTIIRD